jgi:hypothetical protein
MFCPPSATWESFYRIMQRAFPKLSSNLVLNFPDEDGAAKAGSLYNGRSCPVTANVFSARSYAPNLPQADSNK